MSRLGYFVFKCKIGEMYKERGGEGKHLTLKVKIRECDTCHKQGRFQKFVKGGLIFFFRGGGSSEHIRAQKNLKTKIFNPIAPTPEYASGH